MTIAESTILGRLLDYAWLVIVPAVIGIFKRFGSINKRLSDHEKEIALLRQSENSCQVSLQADAARRDRERKHDIELRTKQYENVTKRLDDLFKELRN